MKRRFLALCGALALVRLETLTEEGMAGTVVEYLP